MTFQPPIMTVFESVFGYSVAAATPPIPPTALVLDTFTDDDDTALTAHTPDIAPVGSAWVNTNAIITSNQAVRVSDVENTPATIESGESDCVISVDIYNPGENKYVGAVFRLVDIENYYGVRITTTGIELYERTNSFALRASTAHTYAGPAWHAMTITLSGNLMTITCDGATTSYSSSVKATATKHGLWMAQAGDKFDNFQIYADPWLILFDGDSLTYGSGASETAHNYPSQVIASTDGTYSWENLGEGGQQVATMLANASTKIDARYSAAREKCIVFMWGGINDILASASAATVYDDIVAYHTGRRLAGYKTLAFTILPSNMFTAGMEIIREAVNTSIRANWSTFADALVDVAVDASLDDPDDETYYGVDGTHLTDAGYDVVSALAYAQMIGL